MGSYAYDRANARLIGIKLNRRTDADILQKLESVPNIQAYIKSLIRADIAATHDAATHDAETILPDAPES